MENTELFYFTMSDFRPRMELLEESWNHNFFYFLSRWFFGLRSPIEHSFTLDEFISAGWFSSFDTKKLSETLQKWCVSENPYLSFQIDDTTDVPTIVLEPKTDKVSQVVAISPETFEMVKTLADFKYLCSVIQNCEDNEWKNIWEEE